MDMKTFLHLGCGPKRKDRITKAVSSWTELRFDIDESVQPHKALVPSATLSSHRPHPLQASKFSILNPLSHKIVHASEMRIV